MPNYVTNRLEINADRETVQNVMDFLKGKTDEDSTPCYIDFNNIIPMPKDLLIESHSMDGNSEVKSQGRSITTWNDISEKLGKIRLSYLV